ncbi:MAG: HAMP domain-containing sensor histidine kinase [Candidatus Pacebacteria bacterium]|nr:HAMP domain-containing sensor histidine kinase [Candidatus Paceibacterota bacterium]
MSRKRNRADAVDNPQPQCAHFLGAIMGTMSLRTLLILLFVGALATIFAFILFSAVALWEEIDLLLPSQILVNGYSISSYALLTQNVLQLFVFIFLVFLLLYLLLDRMVIRPFRAIATAVDAFTQHSTQIALPPFKHATKEIRLLADVFMSFTNNVEDVHKKDMEVSLVKSDFISTAAHQLRTPLTGIRWALEALENEDLTEGQKALVKSAVDKSHDLVAIVGTLLDISSIESGKYNYKFESTDAGTMLEGLAQDFQPLAQKSSVQLYYEKTEKPIPHVRADRERIKWVLNNLIENAIRYTPAGGNVRLSMEAVSDKVFIRVRDTGIGILPKDRANIFERFYRAGNAIAKENQGNGLGLYIARTIATDHKGDLDFEQNTEGPGTTFTLSLPIAI